MPELSFRHLLDFLKGSAGPGLGGANGTGDDAGRGDSVEIIGVADSGPLRLRPRNISRPVEIGGPAIGEPAHGVLGGPGGQVTLAGLKVINLPAPAMNGLGDGRTALPGRSAEQIRKLNEVSDE